MIDKIHNLIMNMSARIIQELSNQVRELFICFLNRKEWILSCLLAFSAFNSLYLKNTKIEIIL